MILKHRYQVNRLWRILVTLVATALFAAPAAAHEKEPAASPSPTSTAQSHQQSERVALGFYVSWDPASRDSLQRNAHQLTHLAPEWLRLGSDGESLVDIRVEHDRRLVEPLARANDLTILPLLNNYHGSQAVTVERLLHDSEARDRFIGELRRYLVAQGWHGVTVSFVDIAVEDRDNLVSFADQLALALHQDDLSLAIVVPVRHKAYDLRRLARSADLLIPTLYSEHSPTDPPGSLASVSWTRGLLAYIFEQVPSHKVVLGLANFAYSWPASGDATTLGYQAAIDLAAEVAAGERRGTPITTDEESLTPFFRYTDDYGRAHTVWMLDAVTAYNQWSLAAHYQPLGAALWRLGSEDPSVWSVIGREHLDTSARNAATIAALWHISYGDHSWMTFSGEGSLLYLTGATRDGRRVLTQALHGELIINQRYLEYPAGYTLLRFGAAPKKIVMTFDDGPDPRYTPQILDILKREGVPAAFFVVGAQAQRYPDLVRRMFEEGHEIGIHTYTHEQPWSMSADRVKLEINSTQRIIQAITNHSTSLFRPPYNVDFDPASREWLVMAETASQWNMVVAAAGIDPQDWETSTTAPDGTRRPRTAADIVEQAWQRRNNGDVILLHDAGGDRSVTVEALPLIIQRFRAAGYEFVTFADLAGVPREQLLPPVPAREQLMIAVGRAFLWISHWLQEIIGVLFVLAIVLGVSRQLMLAVLALVESHRERRRTFDPEFRPRVSVVIAAYNEERVIARTVQAVLDNDYPDLEVIVVDDGSRDRTAEVVRTTFAGDSRVTCLQKANGGKASALNRGIAAATGSIIIGLDADTQFARDAIARLVRHFSDPRVGAVAGNVRVGNAFNILTRWQSLEYITSQNFDRRAYALLNCITVVPGAIGAWRREAIQTAGGYTHETLAEDADLTWRLHLNGWLIRNDSTAVAFTEAPERLKNLSRQRFRWSFGVLQCLWKHRSRLFRHGAFGWFALPSLWLHQVLFNAVAPVADVAIIVSLLTGNYQEVLVYYALMVSAELVAGVLSLKLDGSRQWGLLPWLLLQRFVYRQLMYYVILRSLRAALYGDAVGWNKFERTGTVKVTT